MDQNQLITMTQREIKRYEVIKDLIASVNSKFFDLIMIFIKSIREYANENNIRIFKNNRVFGTFI